VDVAIATIFGFLVVQAYTGLMTTAAEDASCGRWAERRSIEAVSLDRTHNGHVSAQIDDVALCSSTTKLSRPSPCKTAQRGDETWTVRVVRVALRTAF